MVIQFTKALWANKFSWKEGITWSLVPDQISPGSNGSLYHLTASHTWGSCYYLSYRHGFGSPRKLKSVLKFPDGNVSGIIVVRLSTSKSRSWLSKPRNNWTSSERILIHLCFQYLFNFPRIIRPPTGSLSTKLTALALSVFLASSIYGISKSGVMGLFEVISAARLGIMLPFNLNWKKISRTLGFAVRLFGNIMSGGNDRSDPSEISPFISRSSWICSPTHRNGCKHIFSVFLALYYIAAAYVNSQEKSNSKALNHLQFKIHTMDTYTLNSNRIYQSLMDLLHICTMMPANGEGRAVSFSLKSIAPTAPMQLYYHQNYL